MSLTRRDVRQTEPSFEVTPATGSRCETPPRPEVTGLIAVEDLRNVLVESVNARDPELIENVDLPDVGELEGVIEMINERFPRLVMTRGDLDDRPVAVVWMPDERERYQQVAHVEVIPERDGPHTEIVEEVDPSLVAEDPSGFTVAEWESDRARDRGER